MSRRSAACPFARAAGGSNLVPGPFGDDLLLELGGEVTRKAAWQFIRKTEAPGFSMLRRFATAMGITVEAPVAEENPKGRSK